MSALTRTVIVAIDESAAALHAFQWAVTKQLNPGDHLRLIHVQPYWEEPLAVGADAVVYTAGKVRESSLQVARKFAQLCRDLHVEDFKEEVIIQDGDVGPTICQYIDKLNTSLNNLILVLGSRELGFFGRAFLVSTSEYCVQHCACPVVIVKLDSK